MCCVLVNPAMFSSLKVSLGLNSILLKHRLPPSYYRNCSLCNVPGRHCLIQAGIAVGKLSRAPSALYQGLGTVQTYHNSDLFWSGPLGLLITQWGILFCFLSPE